MQAETPRINAESRFIALQIALGVPILAGALGILNALRMRRLPDPKPSESADGIALGWRATSSASLRLVALSPLGRASTRGSGR